MKLKVDYKEFFLKMLCTTGMLPRYSCKDYVLMYEGTFHNAPDMWLNVYNMSGKLTITLSGLPNKTSKKPLDSCGTSVKDGRSKDWVLFSNRIFTQQFETDIEIVSGDGSKHPCHKIFLTGNSPVFQAMFKGDAFMEGQTNTVTLENVSEKGVVALLNYLYCVDSKDVEAEYDSGICMELLEASEEFTMTNLQENMKSNFLNKPCNWFQIDATLKLFCFSRNVENCQELMVKCIQVLKSKHGEVSNSEDYKQLFKNNLKAAMDLCNLTLSM